jgi:hypothetical protein
MARFVIVMLWWSDLICEAFLVLMNIIIIRDLGVAYVNDYAPIDNS